MKGNVKIKYIPDCYFEIFRIVLKLKQIVSIDENHYVLKEDYKKAKKFPFHLINEPVAFEFGKSEGKNIIYSTRIEENLFLREFEERLNLST